MIKPTGKVVRLDSFRRRKERESLENVSSIALRVKSRGIIGMIHVDLVKDDIDTFLGRYELLTEIRGDYTDQEGDETFLLELVYADYHAIAVDRRGDSDAARDEIMVKLEERECGLLEVSPGWRSHYDIVGNVDFNIHIGGDGVFWSSEKYGFESVILPWGKLDELRSRDV